MNLTLPVELFSSFVQCIHYVWVGYDCRERNIPEIQSMYEVSFLKLSERYYKATSWPAVELIADVVDQDHVFCLLYKVLQQLLFRLGLGIFWPLGKHSFCIP